MFADSLTDPTNSSHARFQQRNAQAAPRLDEGFHEIVSREMLSSNATIFQCFLKLSLGEMYTLVRRQLTNSYSILLFACPGSRTWKSMPICSMIIEKLRKHMKTLKHFVKH